MANLLFWICFIGGIFLGITMFRYHYACTNLVSMMNCIKHDGNLTVKKLPFSDYFDSFKNFYAWTISLPTTKKYLQ